MKRAILFFLFVIIAVCTTNSQQFKYLRPQDGLYDGEINSIEQDTTGNMWFATWSGLICYDGITFRSFRPEIGNPTSLPDKKIKKLFVDSKDNLWIVTSRSLSLYYKEKNSFVTLNFERRNNSPIDINFLSELDGNLIIHTVEGFYIYPIDKISDPDYKVKKVNILEEKELIQLFNFSTSFAGNLYLVSNSNNPVNSDIYVAVLDTNNTGAYIKVQWRFRVSEKVNFLEYVEPENNIYLATTDGVIAYSLGERKFIKENYFKGTEIRHILFTSDYKLYCSSNNTELLYIDLHLGVTGKYEANPNNYGTLLNNNIHSLFEDFSGNLWIGHQGQGLSIKNLYLKEFDTYRRDPLEKNSLTSNIIMSFNGTNEEVLIGCRTGGLNVMKKNVTNNNSKPEFEVVAFGQGSRDLVFSDGIWNVAQESDTLFWVGTDIGLLKLIKTKGKWKFDQSEPPVYGGIVRKIFIDDQKNIWCGTWNDGLIFIPALKNNLTKNYFQYRMNPNDQESLSDNFVQSILLDSKGRFWIGTVNGFNLLKSSYNNLDLSGNTKPMLKFNRFIAEKKDADYLNNNEINCIYENFDGKIWLATQGGGINIYDPETGSFSYITVADGLPSNDVLGILYDNKGSLWISTNKGLVTYSLYKSDPDITVFNSSDGIQGEIFMVNAYYKSIDGEMYFGGDNGFSCFYPDHIKANYIKPKVALTNLRFSNNAVEVGDTIGNDFILDKQLNMMDRIVIPYRNNTFSIGISSIHFQHPQGNRISYTLNGFYNRWLTIPAERQYAYLSNLPYGKFIFRAKAISSDNIESENIKTLMIEILPPWYKTWYMSIVFFLVIISMIGGFIFILVNRQRFKFEKKIDKITIDNNEGKMVFLTNIAHELRTPLSLVIAPIDDIMQNYKTIDPTWKNHLNLIYRNSRYLLKLINQIVDFRKLSAGKLKLYLQNTDVIRLIKDVVLNFKYMENRRKVNLNINVPAFKVVVSVDSQKIEEVLYNLLSNAFKHTADNHSIIVSLEIVTANSVENNGNGKQLKITVFNEGKDINEKDKKKIFERFYKTDESIEGAGIGLSFSKSLVELHKGSIDVESVEGKGVAFNVYLPYKENSEEQASSEVYVEEEIDPFFNNETDFNNQMIESNSNEKKLKIVIVEDNDELRLFLKNVLSRFYSCYDARDGHDGWNIIKEIIPDIIISDIIMPRKDGYQLCRQIKENLKTCHIPVILLTAKNADNQIISGYNVGADAYVTKPFDMNIILSQISRLIKNRELIREKYITQNFMVEVSNSNPSKDDEFIANIRILLEENLSDSEFNVQKLSTHLNISTTQLYRKLKILTGYSPVEFIRVIKLQKAYNLLNIRKNTVKEVCYLSGFNNLSYFIKCFREHFGVTPANYRDKGFADQFRTDNTNMANMS